ncbi:MAG: hypothetical protein IJ067_09870 [Prevotella sp.]|nr:hypothetical protein [Prevotella sp.]
MILFIFEGNNDKTYFESIKRLFFPEKSDTFVCTYNSNIYSLYSKLQEHDTLHGMLEVNTVSVFKEILLERGEVERFLKINESQHSFAVIYYMRKDGLMATYHPDFIVATREKIYLIETKGNDKLFDKNVRQKQTAAVEWTRKINELKPEERMGREWEYVLISEDNFYGLSANGATITDICDRCKVTLSAAMGELFI